MGPFPPVSQPPRSLLRHPLGWLATGLGSGLLPKAPGTAGSLVALALWLAFLQAGPSPAVQALAVLLAIGPCVLAADWAARRLGRKADGECATLHVILPPRPVVGMEVIERSISPGAPVRCGRVPL